MKMEKLIVENGQWYTDYVNMSPLAFKNIFGISFVEWRNQLDKNDPLKKLKFSEAYCGIDPYQDEINDKIIPVIESSAEKLKDEMDSLHDQV